MYIYAILDENNICHTVYETDVERSDFDQRVIEIETYDIKYIRSRWNDDLNEWEFPTNPDHIWVNGEWKSPDWKLIELNKKRDLYDEITNHLEIKFPNEKEEKLNEILVQFNVELPMTPNNVTVETLEEIVSYLDIN